MSEQLHNLEDVYREFLKAGWNLEDIESADFTFLMKLFNDDKSEPTKDGFDFIAQFLSPEELAQLGE